MPLTTCISCKNGKNARDARRCIECAHKVNTQRKLTLMDRLHGPTDADFCTRLVDKPVPDEMFDKAVTCLAEGAACAECITAESKADKPYDVDACISCTSRFPQAGKGAARACVDCAKLSGDAMQKCVSCIDTMMPLRCSGNEAIGGIPNCLSPPPSYKYGMQGCSACAISSSYNGCVSCLKAKPSSPSCGECAQLKSTTQNGETDFNTAQCFDCALNTKSAWNPMHYTSEELPCSSCAAPSLDFTQRQLCMACLVDSRIQDTARSACPVCVNTCTSPEGRNYCFDCLSRDAPANGPPVDYAEKCKCVENVIVTAPEPQGMPVDPNMPDAQITSDNPNNVATLAINDGGAPVKHLRRMMN